MTAAELLELLEARGIDLRQGEGGRIAFDAPKGELRDDDRAAIAEHRPELLRLLRRREAGVPLDFPGSTVDEAIGLLGPGARATAVDGNPPRPHTPRRFTEDERHDYEERLGVAEDSHLPTAPGSPAERMAWAEAIRGR